MESKRINSARAIEILQEMNTKLSTVDIYTCSPWKTQMTSYIIVFFGKDSPEHSYIHDHDFVHFGLDNYDRQIESAKPSFAAFITGCIENINNYGVKKKEWNHVF